MIAKDVSLLDLHTVSDCQNALDSIKANLDNYQGSRARWDSGRKTPLKLSAKDKVKSIEALQQRFIKESN